MPRKFAPPTMLAYLPNSLRRRIQCFLAALFVALLGIGAVVRSMSVAYEKEHATEWATELARHFAADFQQRLDESKALLTVAATLRLHEQPAVECGARLAALLASYQHVTQLAVAGSEGRIQCTTDARVRIIDESTDGVLRDAARSRRFSVSEHRLDGDGKSTLTAVLPFEGAAGAAPRFMLAVLDLDFINHQFADRVPAGVVVRVLDRNGTFIVRQPDPDCCLGRSGLTLPGIRQAMAASSPQLLEEADWLDGVRRLQVDVPLAELGGGVLSVGMPVETVSRNADSMITKAMLLLLIVATVFGVIAWLAANNLVLRPIAALGSTIRRIRSGDLQAIAAFGNASTELNELTLDVNEMAVALAERDQELRDSEGRLRLTMDAALDAVIGMDCNGRVTAWNAEAERMFGQSRNEVLGRSLADLIIPPAQREAHARGISRFLKTGQGAIIGKRIEVTALRADGREFPVELAIAAVRRGDEVFFNAFLRDITERKRAELDLRVAATSFEAQEGIMITDAHSRILRVNRAFTLLTGYESADVIGKTPSLLSSGRHDAEFYREMWATLARDDCWQGEIWNQRMNGEVYPEWLTISAVRSPDGQVTNFVGAFSDITERKQSEERIRELAFFDSLTRLPNRFLLLDRLQQSLSASERHGTYGAVFFIDLDHFKTLNDTKGHDFGDLLLVEVARRLLGCVRGEDTVARIGGDEFVVALDQLGKSADVAAALAGGVAEKMLEAISLPYELKGHPYFTSCSVGISLFKGNDQSADELLKRADVAMYQAKSVGRSTFRFFDPAMQAALETRARMEFELHHVVRLDQLRLHYQLQIDSGRGVVGAEALLRWVHPERGMVSPAQFIPLAEECGLIVPIGQWVVETACAQLKRWERDARMRHLCIAVNVSARQFQHGDFVAQIRRALEASGANPARLKLEITESMVHENIGETIARMNTLKKLGIGFSMDDFGTGHSSLSNLKRLPLDQLKIDQSFVRDLVTDPNDAAIVKTIIGMARSLGLTVIAEGVETESQRAILAQLGCAAFQGYLFGRPVPVAEFEAQVLTLSDAEEENLPICALH